MSEKSIERKAVTFIGRVGYPKLNPTDPPMQGLPPNERKRWSLVLYMDPNAKSTKDAKVAITDAVAEFEEVHGYEPSKSPGIKKVTEWANKTKTRKNDPSLIGLVSIELGQNAEKQDGGMHPPISIVDVDREPMPHSGIYPGCYVRVIASLDEFKAKSKTGAVITHGLTFYLKVVQFVKDGTRMGGDATDYTQYLDDDFELDGKKFNTSEVSDDDF